LPEDLMLGFCLFSLLPSPLFPSFFPLIYQGIHICWGPALCQALAGCHGGAKTELDMVQSSRFSVLSVKDVTNIQKKHLTIVPGKAMQISTVLCLWSLYSQLPLGIPLWRGSCHSWSIHCRWKIEIENAFTTLSLLPILAEQRNMP
jgi:hypothetical protein